MKNYFCISRALRHLLFTKLLIKELPELLSTLSPSLLLSKRWFPPLKKPQAIQTRNRTWKRIALALCLILKCRTPDLSDHLRVMKPWQHWFIWHFLSLLNKLNCSKSSDLFWFKLQHSQNGILLSKQPQIMFIILNWHSNTLYEHTGLDTHHHPILKGDLVKKYVSIQKTVSPLSLVNLVWYTASDIIV